ncbi:calcium-binding protein [Stenoxybacter acetivorans]|uniref:calcium-binding protein n=1 Tax=Stenoxybacter acetivorans TaxID=422441 RepID=UPI00068BF126|nr:calcium-binding protein [Stenoxybacter acetivorans]
MASWNNQVNVYGGLGNDTIQTADQDDLLDGGLGDDTLTGNGGNDVLIGDAGNDKLYGRNGADTLLGGAGNDYLEGAYQGDTYLFAKGHGQDKILDNSGGTAGDDTIRFEDVLFDEIFLERVGNDLTVLNGQNGDKLTVQNSFSNPNYQIEMWQFADKTLEMQQLLANAHWVA